MNSHFSERFDWNCRHSGRLRTRVLLLSLAVGWASACTTLSTETPLSQDDAFSLASFDASDEQTNLVLRSFEGSGGRTSVSSWLQRDFYLPDVMLKGIVGQAERARKTLREQSPKHASSLRVLAIEALIDGQAQMALGFLKISSASSSGSRAHGEDLLLKGVAYGLLGDARMSRKFLTEAAEHNSASGSAHANLGLLAYQRGNNLEAYEFFKRAQGDEPKSSAFQHLAAEVAYASGRHAVALDHYGKLIARRKSDLLAHYNMGVVYLYGTKDYSNARSRFRFVIEHPKAGDELRAKADGAFASVRREEESDYGLAAAEPR